ncbi:MULTISPECIES: tRNA-dihydrouridine synthase [unclassified Agarivorans]|uniref:tRNA-dihydrouridine synthase n=1 Tax=unclassified Agarivorans TaxID=2636026 RepID=UPI0026E1ED2A|nr:MULTISPECIES: tRNA-dihydrouridine synthase [unclassified Agarivorans]MDO6684869.1 tRNA-dihydrouridine synthase [Agarivorans sp. 3_MG-2023]MDO6714970.1 tRNA-dihydrouridine synthase [Agarivorans sp. 2_MG-2023]
MRVVLAPMEGVADASMRQLLSSCGGYDWCVTEFIRVTNVALPDKVFYKYCPELYEGGFIDNTTPVRVQLLGQHPSPMAANAVRAIELGSHGLDLNFGCPSNTVTGSCGGASMLKAPQSIFEVISAVRQAVPKQHTVSAKIRLGWENKEDCFDIVQAVQEAGADELTIHARTKLDGYKAPAHWHYIKKVKEQFSIPIIANGEVWNRENYLQCQETSGCDDVMIGRGALTIPNLAKVVRGEEDPLSWEAVIELLIRYSQHEINSEKSKYYQSRVKQWLRYLSGYYSEADELFRSIRIYKDTPTIINTIRLQQAN